MKLVIYIAPLSYCDAVHEVWNCPRFLFFCLHNCQVTRVTVHEAKELPLTVFCFAVGRETGRSPVDRDDRLSEDTNFEFITEARLKQSGC